MTSLERSRTIRHRQDEVQEDYLDKHEWKRTPVKKFTLIAFVLQIILILLFAFTTTYNHGMDPTHPEYHNASDSSDTRGANIEGNLYSMIQDVNVMMWIGFGFLLAYLGRYTYGSIVFNMMLGVILFQWAILCNGFTEVAYEAYLHRSPELEKIQLSGWSLLNADFAIASVLIAFGGVLGKFSPLQYLVMGFIEIIFFALNNFIGYFIFKTTDIGGSMFIHLFGAYFGLTVARIANVPKEVHGHPKNTETYKSDVFSMIGTIFLWMFWPSFNAALGSGAQQQRAVINTMLSLCVSCFVTIVWSQRFRGKFKMVDIQNATLAGGVAVGTTANLIIQPFGAMIIGAFAGTVSVFGYVYIQPYLEKNIGLMDTAGIHNLHGMPSVIGSIAGILACAAISTATYGTEAIIAEHIPAMGNSTLPLDLQNYTFGIQMFNRSPGTQAGFQAAAMFLSFGIFTGFIVRHKFFDPPRQENFFDDLEYFEVPERKVAEGGFHGKEEELQEEVVVANVTAPSIPKNAPSLHSSEEVKEKSKEDSSSSSSVAVNLESTVGTTPAKKKAV